MELFEKKTLRRAKSGTAVAAEFALQDRVIGLYFSAYWCPPCRQFTPLLADLYQSLRQRNSPFEIVFVSFDKSEDDMDTYQKEMHADWCALPFQDPSIELLKENYKVTTVPKLLIIKPNGELVTSKGRKEIQDRGIACFRNWQYAANINESLTRKQVAAANNDTDDKSGKSKSVEYDDKVAENT